MATVEEEKLIIDWGLGVIFEKNFFFYSWFHFKKRAGVLDFIPKNRKTK